jgi:hypothetical protein
MPPIIRTIELVVPVIGRSYSPAFLGWFSAMLYSFTWKGVRTAAYNRQFLCQTFLLPCIKWRKAYAIGGKREDESQCSVNYRGATG